MQWQEVFTGKLQKYDGFHLRQDENSLSVRCENPDSFEVTVTKAGSEFQVGYDGWHEHFEDIEEAKNCFAFGFSPECRLKVTLRGKKEYKWTVQFLEDGNWKDDSTTSLLFTRFWLPKSFVYRQNKLRTD